MKKITTKTDAYKDEAPENEEKEAVKKTTTATKTKAATKTKTAARKTTTRKTAANAKKTLSAAKKSSKTTRKKVKDAELPVTEQAEPIVAIIPEADSATEITSDETVSTDTVLLDETFRIETPTTEVKVTAEEKKEENTTTEEKAEIEDEKNNSVKKPKSSIKQSKAEQPDYKVPSLPQLEIHDIVELSQAPQRAIVLTDQQIQQLSIEEIRKRHSFLQHTLARVLDYDVVISDTNIWVELLLGHTSSHSDPRYNARLQFERQLEFISKLTKYRGGRFMMLSETYEEIDRFATMQDPTDYRDADFTDNMVCLNTAARLAKRLILSQQRENRLRIDNIGAESHHASFADPAIIRCVADLFAAGKKVLVLTNDASVAIRSIGICDDLQRHNNISDEEWNSKYVPLRPMVFTFDDLKLLDFYTRQYHYIQMASGEPWMSEISSTVTRAPVEPLTLWLDAFRPGDKHRGDNIFPDNTEQQKQQKQQKQNAQTKNSSNQKARQKPALKQEQPTKQKQNTEQKQNVETEITVPTPNEQPIAKEDPQNAEPQNPQKRTTRRKTQNRRKSQPESKQKTETKDVSEAPK